MLAYALNIAVEVLFLYVLFFESIETASYRFEHFREINAVFSSKAVTPSLITFSHESFFGHKTIYRTKFCDYFSILENWGILTVLCMAPHYIT